MTDREIRKSANMKGGEERKGEKVSTNIITATAQRLVGWLVGYFPR